MRAKTHKERERRWFDDDVYYYIKTMIKRQRRDSRDMNGGSETEVTVTLKATHTSRKTGTGARCRARTEMRFQESGGGVSPPPSVQFKLYQGEVLPYNPGTGTGWNPPSPRLAKPMMMMMMFITITARD